MCGGIPASSSAVAEGAIGTARGPGHEGREKDDAGEDLEGDEVVREGGAEDELRADICERATITNRRGIEAAN